MSTVSATTTAEQLIERDRQLLIHPYLPGATEERVVMTEVAGCRLRDVEGREYLDATGGLWLAQVGMMLGIELVADKQTRTPISMHAAPHDVIRRETGVLVRDCAHTLVLSPPLVMSEAEAGEVVTAVRSVLERVQPDGSIAAS
jgi:adenosylmethionine-8-amino-7-oxononanoate aminotransferase